MTQPVQGLRQRPRPQHPPAELDQLGVDPVDLREPHRVEVRRPHLEGRVMTDRQRVRRLAARDPAEARPVVPTRGGQHRFDQRRMQPLQRGTDDGPHGLGERRPEARPVGLGPPVECLDMCRGRHQRPGRVGLGKQRPQDVDGPLDRRARGDPAVGEAPAQVRGVRVHVRPHRAPARQQMPALCRRRAALVVDDGDQHHGDAFQRIDRPVDETRVEDRKIADQRLVQRRMGDPVRGREGRRVERLEVAEQARRPRPGRRDAGLRLVGHPIVAPGLTDQRRGERPGVEDRLPVGLGEGR